MKLFSVIILSILFNEEIQAQVLNAEKYIWQSETTKTSASIEIFDNDYKKSKGYIYFISTVDTAYNSYADSLFTYILNSSANKSTLIKISFYPTLDSSKMSVLSEELMKFIIPDLTKKFSLFTKANAVLVGINDYGLVALHTATYYSDKINKTAVFFNNYLPDEFLCNQICLTASLIKGKLFMYVNGNDEIKVLTDKFAEKLALNSSILLYKYDEENADTSISIFTEAYNWLVADGNNYIITTED